MIAMETVGGRVGNRHVQMAIDTMRRGERGEREEREREERERMSHTTRVICSSILCIALM